MDERVKAIREHELIGRGSCSTIDECYSDADLVELFDTYNVKTPQEAIAWAIKQESLCHEQALNARWGEDDDPQLKAWREWQERSEHFKK